MRKMSTSVLMHLYNDLATYGVNNMVNCVMSMWVVVTVGRGKREENMSLNQ
jgi:hypothetical protein